MSRSYKAPWFTDSTHGSLRRKYFKRYSNKRARKRKLPNGNKYRRNGLTYDICDYRFYCPDDPKARRK